MTQDGTFPCSSPYACSRPRVDRLIILAGAHARSTRGSLGEAEHTATGGLLFDQTDMADLHLTLSRTLLLQGAHEEADGHARAAEYLLETTALPSARGKLEEAKEEEEEGEEEEEETQEKASDGGRRGGGTSSRLSHDNFGSPATASLRLEIELLSRTPVVLETNRSAQLLREELLELLATLGMTTDKFWGSIPSPLGVGVRAQFLATYQVLRLRT